MKIEEVLINSLDFNKTQLRDLKLNELDIWIDSKFKSFGLIDFCGVENMTLSEISFIENLIDVVFECIKIDKILTAQMYKINLNGSDIDNTINIICNIIYPFINKIYNKKMINKELNNIIIWYTTLKTAMKASKYTNVELEELIVLVFTYNRDNKYKSLESYEKKIDEAGIALSEFTIMQKDYRNFKGGCSKILSQK